MAKLHGPQRPLDQTADGMTQGGGPPSGSPQTMPPPPARISYSGMAGPHVPQVGHRVKVTLHGVVAGHSMHGKVEGGAPGMGQPSGTLELHPHKMTVEQDGGEQEGPKEPGGDNPREERAEARGGGDKVGAAKGTDRASTSSGGGTMVDMINKAKSKYRPIRGTAGPISGAAS